DRDAAGARGLEHVDALEAVDRDLRGLDERERRVLAHADRLQEHAVLGEHGDAVVALVGDVEAALRREGDALGIVELAVALAARGEDALRLALAVDDREQVVAGVDDGESAGARHEDDAAQLLRLESPVLARELDAADAVAGDAPEHAALALDEVDAAV